MGEATTLLECMQILKERGYKIFVIFIGAYKDISYDACNLRANIMKDSVHIIRKVPKSFHDYCIDTLPDSIDIIYNQGFKNNIIDDMRIINRNNEIIWSNDNENSPKEVYLNCLNNKSFSTNLENSRDLADKGNKREMLGLIKEIDYLKKLREGVLSLDNNISIEGNVVRK